MRLLAVRCQHCGAPLQVGEAARFVTCQFCRTELTVERTDSAVFTQKIAEIHAHASQMAGDLEVIQLQNDLERLDREWLMERERYLVAGKDGHKHEPGSFGWAGGALAVIMGAIWVGISLSTDVPGFFLPMGLVAIGLGAIGIWATRGQAASFEKARSRYQIRRFQIASQLAAVRNEHS